MYIVHIVDAFSNQSHLQTCATTSDRYVQLGTAKLFKDAKLACLTCQLAVCVLQEHAFDETVTYFMYTDSRLFTCSSFIYKQQNNGLEDYEIARFH